MSKKVLSEKINTFFDISYIKIFTCIYLKISSKIYHCRSLVVKTLMSLLIFKKGVNLPLLITHTSIEMTLCHSQWITYQNLYSENVLLDTCFKLERT